MADGADALDQEDCSGNLLVLCGIMIIKTLEKRRTSRNDNPRRIHASVVTPLIQVLRSAVREAAELFLEEDSAKVQGNTIEVADADDALCDVAEARVALDDGKGSQEGKRTPGENSQGFNAEHKGVRCHVSRVGQRVLLPQLGKDVLLAGECGVVEDVVAWAIPLVW